MDSTRLIRFGGFAMGALALVGASTTVRAQLERSDWNDSAEPSALYGHCGQRYPSAMGTKLYIIEGTGIAVTDVLAIKILSCKTFDGGGDMQDTPCPKGSAYDRCRITHNDGKGNAVTFGILLAGARSDPNELYEGCPDGADRQTKISVMLAAGEDPRLSDGIVTLRCKAATAKGAQPAKRVACPNRPAPFVYCLSTNDDGHGNAVVLGVVRTFGTGDPAGLYGRCDTGVSPTFVSKRSVLPLVDRPADNVRTIDLLNCAIPSGYGGGFPSTLVSGACEVRYVMPAMAARYDYCIWGTDPRNNGVVMGVSGK